MISRYPENFDVVVVGAGHAGCEAALAAARLGARVALLTMDLDTVAKMSCNPAVGGVAKGQTAAEVDALGGAIARAADIAGIHFKILNRSKGAAVQSPRIQCDRRFYSSTVKHIVEKEPRVFLRQAEATDIAVGDNGVEGVIAEPGVFYPAKAVILTAGTFLNGVLHVGLDSFRGGRFGERPSEKLSPRLEKLGIEIKRFKTGTPPRLSGRTIDFAALESQPSDDERWTMSLFTDTAPRGIVSCAVTYTDEKTREVISRNLDRSPLYGGVIKSVGPRYCPSIEDKIVKFPDRARHQVFLEPEGLDTEEYYANGISTSMPPDVQEGVVRTLAGCSRAEILRYGYAVEYDYAPPTQLKNTLETKSVENLYLAGQINGTTGYEEAAALGLVAGVNAALKIAGREPLVLRRDEAYIGVLVDDLVTKGVTEPYRLFTARAEYRLLLRWDNTDLRLLPRAFELGFFDEKIRDGFMKYKNAVARGVEKYSARSFAAELTSEAIAAETDYEPAAKSPWAKIRAARQIVTQLKYAGYIRQQAEQIKRLKNLEEKKIPADFDYDSLKGVLNETRDKLKKIRPATLGQAMRVSGVTPSDAAVVHIQMERRRAGKGCGKKT